MSREEIMQTLGDKLDKVVRITSSKGVVQYLTVVNLDDEGFVHTLNDGILNAVSYTHLTLPTNREV